MVSGVPATKFPETWTPLNSSKESLTRTQRRFLHLFYKSLRAQILLVKAERVSVHRNFCNNQFNHFIFSVFFCQNWTKIKWLYQQLSFLKREPHWILQKNHWHVHEEDFFISFTNLWELKGFPFLKTFVIANSTDFIFSVFFAKIGLKLSGCTSN